MKQYKIDESGLNIIENADGTFQMEWDKGDPRWSWLNGLTDSEIKVIVEQAIKEELQRRD
jgi:hypothetical protein